MTAMPNSFIFPTSGYGVPSTIYGTNITQYNTAPNTTGFPAGSGLRLGAAGMLFDGTWCQMLKANGTIPANDAVIPVASTENTVVQSTASTNVPVKAINDRAGAQLTANGFAWMTIKGKAEANVAASLTAPLFLASSAVAGRLAQAVAGTSQQGNLILMETSTTAGNYDIFIA